MAALSVAVTAAGRSVKVAAGYGTNANDSPVPISDGEAMNAVRLGPSLAPRRRRVVAVGKRLSSREKLTRVRAVGTSLIACIYALAAARLLLLKTHPDGLCAEATTRESRYWHSPRPYQPAKSAESARVTSRYFEHASGNRASLIATSASTSVRSRETRLGAAAARRA